MCYQYIKIFHQYKDDICKIEVRMITFNSEKKTEIWIEIVAIFQN